MHLSRSSQMACARDLDGPPSLFQKRGDLHRETSLGTTRRTTPPGGLKIRQEGVAGGGRGPSRPTHCAGGGSWGHPAANTLCTSIPHKFSSFKHKLRLLLLPLQLYLYALNHHFLDHQTTCSSAAAPGGPYNAGQGSSVFMS